MPEINLIEDAIKFREALESTVAEFDAETLSAIEVGFDCDEEGWIFIHGDRRPVHEADGDWTIEMDDENTLFMEHWVEARDARYEGESLSLKKMDGSSVELSPIDEAEEEHEEEDPLPAAIGEMIRTVLLQAKDDGVFKPLTEKAPLQLCVEDFSGTWEWPEQEELGTSNLA